MHVSGPAEGGPCRIDVPQTRKDSQALLGLVWKADSMFNTPLISLKDSEGYRVVQNFRALNKTLTHKPIKFKEIYKTLAEIEKE